MKNLACSTLPRRRRRRFVVATIPAAEVGVGEEEREAGGQMYYTLEVQYIHTIPSPSPEA